MELGQPGGNPYAGIGQAVKNTTKSYNKAKKSKSSGRSHYSGGGGSSHNYGGGGGGGRSYSGGGGGGGGGFVSHTSAPVIPSINAYLGTDSVYQGALSGGKRTLKDALAELGRRRGEATTQYNQTKSSMARDRLTQLDDIRQEYASRGLINSGLFGDATGKFEKQYLDQLNSLNNQQTGLLGDLLSQQNNYQREYELAIQQAKQEALARRAAKYQIG